jgi:hypothetical protein
MVFGVNYAHSQYCHPLTGVWETGGPIRFTYVLVKEA